jgi:hypothetical protein
MQNYEHYRHGIHTTGQATDRVRYCCTDFSYRFGLRVLMTFQGALLFIIALQANTLISVAIDEPVDGETKKFDTTRFAIIMVFTFAVIILSYVKEYYVKRHSGDDSKYDSIETGVHFAHGHYQK